MQVSLRDFGKKVLSIGLIFAVLAFSTLGCTKNEVVSYAEENGIPTAIIQELKPLGPEMDENEKAFIDTLKEYPDEQSNLLVLVKDEKIDNYEKAFLDNLQGYSDPYARKLIEALVEDGISGEGIEALNYLSALPQNTQEYFIDFGLNVDVVSWLVIDSELNKEFANYIIENKLCIQDHKLTELEKKFLQEPNKYTQELFDFYIVEANKIYPELSNELLKLPDFMQRELKDVEALEDIIGLAVNPECWQGFSKILNEGIKEKGKYCTLLQALLWIAYDEELDKENPLKDYSLGKLLGNAWENTVTSSNYKSERWKNFEEVIDRLNAPKFIEIYMQNNFSYSYTRGEAEGVKSAERIFNDKKGACYDHALFAAYCLKKNGYDKAWGARVRFDRIVQRYFIGHIGCIYQDPKDSLYYTFDFGIVGYAIYGPFKSIKEAVEHICSGGNGGSRGEAGLSSYSLHDIDLRTGKYKTTWHW